MQKDIVINNEIPAYYSAPDDKRKHPAIIVIHEIWGLNDHIKDVTNRIAKQGYAALAPNLFHGMSFEGKIDHSILAEMADPAKRDEAQKKMREILAPIRSPEFAEETIAKLKECFSFLMKDEHVDGNIAVTGFCFGGTYAFALAAHEPRMKASIPFYGQPPEPLNGIAEIKCPVLAFYGEQDARLIEGLPALKGAAKECGVRFEAIVYPNTGHAFFNDTNKNMYRQEATDDAWKRVLIFLKQYVG